MPKEQAQGLGRDVGHSARFTGSRTAIGIGMATLVTVLVAVLLTTFSVLALVSARADLNLSEKVADAITSYYTADSEAEKWLKDVRSQFQTTGRSLSSLSALSDTPVYEAEDGSIVLSKTFAMDRTRNLVVQIEITTDHDISINRWQVVAN